MLSLLLDAAWMTLGLALASLVGGMVLALAFSAAELSKQRALVWPVATLTTLIRGLPELLVVLFIYFGSTQVLFLLTGEYVEMSPFWCGVLALALLFLAFVLLYAALRALAVLLQMPHQARRWRMQQKERGMNQSLLEALSHLQAGRFLRARISQKLLQGQRHRHAVIFDLQAHTRSQCNMPAVRQKTV